MQQKRQSHCRDSRSKISWGKILAGVGGYHASKQGGLAGVFRCANDGSDWKHALSESEAFTVFVHPHDPNLVFAVTADGVYRSTDGGLSHRCRLSDFLTSHHSTLIAIPSGAEGSRLR